MENRVIVRYGELGLKGANRAMFEKRLVENMKAALKRAGVEFESIVRERGRIYVHSWQAAQAAQVLTRVFGIVSVSPAEEIGLQYELIESRCVELAQQLKPKTFAVRARRLNKGFKLTSEEVNRQVGAAVVAATGTKVKLENPELEIGIEISRTVALIYSTSLAGPGGLPVGVSGRVLAMISGPRSILAAWLMMKRGCEIVAAHWGQGQVDLSALNAWAPQEIELVQRPANDMWADAEKLAAERRCLAIVTGETLEDAEKFRKGQVAILRPLIGFTAEQIEEMIGRAGASA